MQIRLTHSWWTTRRVLVLVALLSVILGSPWLGGFAVKGFILGRASERLSRPVKADGCRLGWMHAILSGVEIDGWGRIGRIVAWRHAIELEQPRLTLDRAALDKVRGRSHGGGEGGSGSPMRLIVREGALIFSDRSLGVSVKIDRIDCDLTGRTGSARLEGLSATHTTGASLRARTLELELQSGQPTNLQVKGGDLVLYRDLSLSGIDGTIVPNLGLEGGYAGVPGKLWRATGRIDPIRKEGEVVLDAKRFTLDKLAPILADSPILDLHKASMSGRLEVSAVGGRIGFRGSLGIEGLDIGNRVLAGKPVRDLSVQARLQGALYPERKRLELEEATLSHHGASATLDGSYDLSAPRPRLEARLRVPPVPCQTALAALPRPLVPAIADFKVTGTFGLDVTTKIDWNDLQSLELGGSVGINGCKVVEAPALVSALRLAEPFDHRVEIEAGHEIDFAVGPQNPEWTPFQEVSQNIVNSLMTTEDNGFFKHRGFITREFRSALLANLERGYIRLGASSITMQMVKNVLLSREKTLSRKLQEMFLTWYLEQNLPKERIFEIYLNVIEFGPGIYGIGRAMHHYFGKSPKEATPREAAFFSSILPNPKRRYVHYCHGQLSEKWELYLNRILKRMHERGRLSDTEFADATARPLAFDRKEALPEKECLDWIKRLTTTAPVDAETDVQTQPSDTR